jgi:hypothetical protein
MIVPCKAFYEEKCGDDIMIYRMGIGGQEYSTGGPTSIAI